MDIHTLMKFRRKTSPAEAPVETTTGGVDTAPNADRPSLLELRELLWQGLGNRMGTENVLVLREDFEQHVANDPIEGVEEGYLCMVGKLIQVVDQINDMGSSPFGRRGTAIDNGADQPVSPFTMYRKD